PTEEMMRAWNEAVPDAVEAPHADGWTPPADTTFRARWQAALSASPVREGALQPQGAASVPTGEADGAGVGLRWRDMADCPTDAKMVVAKRADGHMMVWRADLLTLTGTPRHLQFDAVAWVDMGELD